MAAASLPKEITKRGTKHRTGLFIGKFVKFMISYTLASGTSIIGTTTVFIIDIAVPGDGNVESKEKEKQEKYQDLAREISGLWKAMPKVIPIVVETLGVIPKTLKGLLRETENPNRDRGLWTGQTKSRKCCYFQDKEHLCELIIIIIIIIILS